MVADRNFQMANYTHPGQDRLQAYTLGKCPPQEIRAIYQHLADCPSCMTRLDTLPGVDPFVAWLRRLMLIPIKERT